MSPTAELLRPAPDPSAARALFAEMPMHLAPQAVTGGTAPGVVYLDDPSQPRSALLRAGYRFYLAGEPRNDQFNEALRRLFAEVIYPQAHPAGEVAYSLHYPSAGWEREIEAILQGKHPLREAHRHYALTRLRHDWRALLPAGFAVRAVDDVLLREEGLGSLDALREEMVSECPSVEYFVAHRFGRCITHGDELAGWCLSEYNCADACEVGIETRPAYRRRGLATVAASALVEQALSRGMARVGWHCHARNEASSATALKVGFELSAEYTTYFAWFDEVANLAVNGNQRLWQRDYKGALAWYRRAFAAGDPPAWAWLRAAEASSLLGEVDAALGYLQGALERGFADAAYLREAPALAAARESAGWAPLLRRLAPEG